MRFLTRAAAIAPALIWLTLLAAAPAAAQSPALPQIASVGPAATALSIESLGLNDLTDPIEGDAAIDPSQPLAAHAMAPVFPGPEEAAPEGVHALADLVAENGATETPDEESECLARAVYFESHGEPLAGQLAVAEVIINRARSGRFPASLCAVVRQPSQFSFVRGGFIPQPPLASIGWRNAVAIAHIAQAGLAAAPAPRALFFHARRVNPGWRLTRIATVGNHIFYR